MHQNIVKKCFYLVENNITLFSSGTRLIDMIRTKYLAVLPKIKILGLD